MTIDTYWFTYFVAACTREIFEVFQKYFTKHFMKYFTPKNFMKFYNCTPTFQKRCAAPGLFPHVAEMTSDNSK